MTLGIAVLALVVAAALAATLAAIDRWLTDHPHDQRNRKGK